ncbi:MAG: DUF3450 domain-containing protein [Candidatus Competibacteraceae bacterium]|nr:DUF3450 domain-containing protein [Candidatus Competibacteraceae bacterium]
MIKLRLHPTRLRQASTLIHPAGRLHVVMNATVVTLVIAALLCILIICIAAMDLLRDRRKSFRATNLVPVSFLALCAVAAFASVVVSRSEHDRLIQEALAWKRQELAASHSSKIIDATKRTIDAEASTLENQRRDLTARLETLQAERAKLEADQATLETDRAELQRRINDASIKLGTFPEEGPAPDSTVLDALVVKLNDPDLSVAERRQYRNDIAQQCELHSNATCCTWIALNSRNGMGDIGARARLFEGCLLGDDEACELLHRYYATTGRTSLAHRIPPLTYRNAPVLGENEIAISSDE